MSNFHWHASQIIGARFIIRIERNKIKQNISRNTNKEYNKNDKNETVIVMKKIQTEESKVK